MIPLPRINSRYAVVACSECHWYWIVEGWSEIIACPRCGTRYEYDRRRFLFKTDNADEARQARASILADRAGCSEEYDAMDHFSEQGIQAMEWDLVDFPYSGLREYDVEKSRKDHRERYGFLVGDQPFYADAFADSVGDQPFYTDAFAGSGGDRPFYADVFTDEITKQVSSECTTISEFLDGADDPFPWARHPTGPSKTQFVVTTALAGDSPTGWTVLKYTLEEAFGGSNPKYYERANSIADHYPELLEKRKKAPTSEVRTTDKALYLMRSMYNSGTLPWAGPTEVSETDYDALPAKRFRAGVGARRRVLSDAELGHALLLLGDHRSTLVEDSGGSKILHDGTVTECQRFATPSRAIELGQSFDRIADEFEENHEYAVALTLTLPRGCADSPVHSYTVLQDAWEKFYQRMRYDKLDRPRPGFVPKHMWIQEPQRDGWAHRHVIFPGWTRLMDADDVRADWADCLRIPTCADETPWVRLDTLALSDGWHVVESHTCGDQPIPKDTEDSIVATGSPEGEKTQVLADGSGLSLPEDAKEHPGLRGYYRKGMTRLAELANLTPAEVYECGNRLVEGKGTDREREFARLTFMWASEARFTATSGT